MLETFMVLIVIVIILGLGMYFFFKGSMESTVDKASEVCMQSSVEILSSLVSIPELQCSFQGVETTGCIDVVKMQAFIDSKLASKRFAVGNCKKTIVVEQFYPVPSGSEGCSAKHIQANTYDECQNWTLYKPVGLKSKVGRIVSVPVSLYYPSLLEYRIGKVRMKIHQVGAK